MKRGRGNTDRTGPPDDEAYGYRSNRAATLLKTLPANDTYDLSVCEKREVVIVRRRSDGAIVMVVKGNSAILRPV